MATRLVARSLAVIVGVGLLALVLTAWHGVVLGGGAYWDNTMAAPARIAFSFFLGVFLNRYATGDSRDGNLNMLFLLVLCGALMSFDAAEHVQLYSLVVIVLIWPWLVLVASRLRLSGFWRWIALFSGNISYAIYVLHTPLIRLSHAAVEAVTDVAWHEHGLPFILATSTLIIAVSAFAHYAYDKKYPGPAAALAVASSRERRRDPVLGGVSTRRSAGFAPYSAGVLSSAGAAFRPKRWTTKRPAFWPGTSIRV
ncbi:acyltransferase family protein [Mesorhizobium sp. M0053]|uniref:acyltransferase family protein n=1 Tax=Mesorhizobium sp. M0053 TaxID=2956864 RepID=UPI00333E1392